MAEPDGRKYLDPAGLARLGNMPLVSRQVVEGFLTGRHRSPYQGFSIEYLDHRPYVPGDEIRTVDWKVLARTDKFFVKLFEQETNLRATIVVDGSRSMDFRSDENGISKRDYGCHLAGALAYLLLKQNDAVGLCTFDSEIRQYLSPKAHPTQFRRLMTMLEKVESKPDTNLGSILDALAERVKRRGLVILISDMIDRIESVVDGLHHLKHQKHEIIVFHVMDRAELTFPFDRMTVFKDMEGTGILTTNPAAVRKGYLERLEKFMDTMRSECLKRKIDYNLVTTDQPYDMALAGYLHKRVKLG